MRSGTRQRDVRAQIQRMVRRIVRQFAPERIILFGSHARGEAGADSDVDLLVVMPLEGDRRHKRIEIGMSLADFGLPVDIVLCTPEEFASRGQIPGTIERPALLEGKVLYEQR
jgi:predicted nucleotidyltransferase